MVGQGMANAVSGLVGGYAVALAKFAERYAGQNERDYASLKAATEAGRIEAQSH